MIHDYAQRRSVGIWLALVCFCIIMVVGIGGLTRLEGAGLSITQWKPITGIVPPMDKNSPEYIKLNRGMDLHDFKFIYLLEFFHRLAGRLVAIVFLLPLLFFVARGTIKFKELSFYGIVALLFAAQGFMGWYMVKSGLISDPHVSHYRLGAHLLLAMLIYSLLFWRLMKNSFDILLIPTGYDLGPISFWAQVSLFLLFWQIFLGALVAGLGAGHVYNDFPYMGESFVPYEFHNLEMWDLQNFANPVFVQFMHRNIAYILFFIISLLSIRTIRMGNSKLTKAGFLLLFSLILQVGLGIFTLIEHVPVYLGLMHQLGAIFLLSCLLWLLFLTREEV